MMGWGALLVALAVATLVGLVWRTRTGRVRAREATVDDERVRLLESIDAQPREAIQVTLLQLSSTFCAPCRATRTRLASIAASTPGVRHVDVDVSERLDVARALDVRSTPTTAILDADGAEIGRAVGVPRPEQVRAVLASVVAAPTSHAT